MAAALASHHPDELLMDNFGSGIAVNIISSILWALAGAAVVGLYATYKKRRETVFNRFAQMPYSVKLVHLTYGLVDLDSEAQCVQEADVSAICSILALLHARFGSKKIGVLASNAALSQFGTLANLVSVSGPEWNPITRAILLGNPISVTFGKLDEDEDVLVDRVGKEPQYYRTNREGSVIRECYAIVYRGSRDSSTSDGKEHFVVAAGVSALGTFGAVTCLRRWSTQPSRMSPFVRALRKREHALVVLRVRDLSPNGFHAYRSGPESPGFLHIDVIAEYRSGRPLTKWESLRSIFSRRVKNLPSSALPALQVTKLPSEPQHPVIDGGNER